MEIIDAQIHVWQPNSVERPWPSGAVSRQGGAFSVEQALAEMDAAGVSRAILVPPFWAGGDSAYALEAARRHPSRFAVMGHFDPDLAGGVERLHQWRHRSGMLGIRLLMDTEATSAYAMDKRYAWLWAGCENARLPLMCCLPGHVAALGPIALRHRKLRLIVDHAGRDPDGSKDAAAWKDLDDLLQLARYPNVAVKLSSLPCFSTAPYPFPVLHGPIERIYDAFGATRLIWGSDATRLTHPYRDNLRLFTEGLSFLTENDRDWILGGAAAEWCDWSL